MTFNRRLALQSLGIPLTPTLAACAGPTAMNPSALAETVEAAFVYAFPLYEMARTRWNALDNPANPVRAQANVVGHRRNLADHRARTVTTPNNDTLYSACFIDLSAGPVRVSVAPMPAGRYWSVALMDFFTNHFGLPGSRLDGRGPVQATLVGPQGAGALPAGRVIRAPGNDVWLLARWLVDGGHDLDNARAMQAGLSVEGPAPAAAVRPVPQNVSDPANFLAVVNDALARNPAPAADDSLLNRYAAVGVQPGAQQAWQQLPPLVREAWQARIGPALAGLRGNINRGGRDVQGWRFNHDAMGDFGSHHVLRAAVALGGLAALPPTEAMYMMRYSDQTGAPLDGQHRYRVRVPAGGVPCDAFWSLTAYELQGDGRRFFFDNPINRYAIGDRTPGLLRQADGSLDITLQREAPADASARANWLPIGPGPISLSLRAYLPQRALRDGAVTLPTVERLA